MASTFTTTAADEYKNDIILLGTTSPSTINTGTNYLADIIYVPTKGTIPKRGFVFTAGSIAFGTSLLVDPDLSILMNNVLNHTDINLSNSTSSLLPINNYSNSTIYVDGIFTIDNNITFDNCIFKMKPNAKIELQNNAILTLNNCTLHAGCDAVMWDGIYADDASEQIIMNGCTVSDMENGVILSKAAKLMASFNTFINNAKQSIYIFNQNNSNLSDIQITNNSFNCTTNLLQNNSNITKTLAGISIMNVHNIVIGNQATTGMGNSFNNLKTGIHIYSDANITTELGQNQNRIDIIDNTFTNIKDEPANYIISTSGNTQNKVYTSNVGAAVYINYEASPSFDGETFVNNIASNAASNPLINNCDKAVVSKNANLNAYYLNINNCKFGIMAHSLISRYYIITDNVIANPHIGIQTIGNTDVLDILNNTISQCIHQIDHIGPVQLYSPIGIDIKHWVNPITGQGMLQDISGNHINLAYHSGVGLAVLNANDAQNTAYNTISFGTSNATSFATISDYTQDLTGISFINSSRTNISNNNIDGITSTNPAVYTARQSKGIYFQDSKDCNISCNRIKYTKQGFYGFGDNSTASGNITYNKMHHTQSPLYTYDRVTPGDGTFGNILAMPLLIVLMIGAIKAWVIAICQEVKKMLEILKALLHQVLLRLVLM